MLTRREILVLALAFLVTLPAVTKRLYASDEVQYFSWLRSLAFDHDADFENEFRHFHDTVVPDPGFAETFLAPDRRTATGRPVTFAPLGSALLWAPFYAVGHLVALTTGAPADGYSQPYVSAVAIGSACYGFLAVLLSAAIARQVVGRGLSASLLVAAGTPLLFYVYVAPPFSHAASAFAVSLFVWLWLRARRRWALRDVVWLGLSAGLMAMVREQDVFFAAGPALDFALWATGLRRAAAAGGPPVSARPVPASAASAAPSPAAALTAALAGTVATLVAFAPQLAGYWAVNGRLGPATYVARKMTWTSPHAGGVLVDPHFGFLAWTPLGLVALAGLAGLAARRIARDRPEAAWIGAVALFMFACQVYVSGSVESWTVAGAFGQRRFVGTTPLLVIGVAAALEAARTRRARVALGVVLGICVWWNLGLMALFGLNRMDRQRLSIPDQARDVFLELPVEAPGIAWRYLAHRSSFFRQPPQR
ncbi:MAG: glycosyltransferase family 39 protein [Vicinamibacterales bacterium]